MSYITPGWGEFALQFRLEDDAELMLTTMGFTNTNDGTLDGLGTALGQIAVALTATGSILENASLINAGWVWESIKATMVGTDGGPLTLVTPVNMVGTGTASGPPNNCALLVHKYTSRPGREGQGRCFVPPYNLDETDIAANGTLDTGDIAFLQGRWDTFLDEVEGSADAELSLLHSGLSPLPDRITSFVVDSRVATQRRRLRP